jgi:hypothetical protein
MDPAFTGRIPDSVLPYPDGLWNRTKYAFWKIISPGYEWGRDTLLRLGFIHHEGRQNFVIGTLAPGAKLDDFLHYIKTQQFGNHFVAWTDEDQVISLRRLESFDRQYHLRIFSDGEVRGHYEWTPESHPKWHLQEVGMEPRSEEFARFLGDWIVPMEKISVADISQQLSWKNQIPN